MSLTSFIRKASVPVLIAASAATSFPAYADWLEHTHDFGAFREEMGVMKTTFKYVNTSDSPIYILSARANCGCTTPAYSRDPVAPGDTARVTVGFNPTGRIGKFEKYVIVETGAPDSTPTRTKLIIKGTVIGSGNTIAGRYPVGLGTVKLRADAVPMGEVVKGRTATASLGGYNTGTDSATVTVEGLPDYITATVRPKNVAPGEMVNILFTLNSSDCPDWGIMTRECTVKNGEASQDIDVVAILVEDFSHLTPEQLSQAPTADIPAQVTFGEISRSDNEKTVTAEVTNRGKSVLLLRRVYTTDPGIVAYTKEQEVKPGESTEIVVKADPGALRRNDGILNSRIVIITNDPARPQAVLRATGAISD